MGKVVKGNEHFVEWWVQVSFYQWVVFYLNLYIFYGDHFRVFKINVR